MQRLSSSQATHASLRTEASASSTFPKTNSTQQSQSSMASPSADEPFVSTKLVQRKIVLVRAVAAATAAAVVAPVAAVATAAVAAVVAPVAVVDTVAVAAVVAPVAVVDTAAVAAAAAADAVGIDRLII
jgi:hypothetical protein